MLKIDKKTVADFEEKLVKKVKVYFVSGGCSGTKVDIAVDDFEVDEALIPTLSPEEREKYWFEIYVEKKDFDKFENATITRLVKADHTGEAKARYIYSNDAIQDRCGCGTSFAFEKKKPKFDFTKLKSLKEVMKQDAPEKEMGVY